jgi:hypothetical protein
MGKMRDRQPNLLKFRQFVTTCLVGAMFGGILCGAGTFLHRHSYSRQSLWRGERIELRGSSASDYIKANFTPKDNYRRVLNLCVGMSDEAYETFKKTPVPQIEWQALLGGQPVSNQYTSIERSWDWSSQYGACAWLGSFSVLADRQYQIQLKSQQVNQLSFPSAPYLNVKPDVMEMKGFMTNYQLGGVFLQTLGISVFTIAVVKGVINLLKSLPRRV